MLATCWDRVAPSLAQGFRKFGLRERVRQAGKAPAGAMRTGSQAAGGPDQAASPGPACAAGQEGC